MKIKKHIIVFVFLGLTSNFILQANTERLANTSEPGKPLPVKEAVNEQLGLVLFDTATLTPTDDAYTQNGNWTGTSANIVRIQQKNPVREAYLNFNLSSINGTITAVELQWTGFSDAGSGVIDVYKGENTGWTETNATSANVPGTVGGAIGSVTGGFTLNTVQSVILDPSVFTQGVATLILKQRPGGDDLGFASKENTTHESAKLIVTYTPGAGDSTPPSAPAGLNSSNVTTNSVDLSWTASTDNVGVTGYNLYVNGSFSSALGNVTSHTVTGLSPSTAYTFNVSALDAAGNESAQSNTVNATTNATPDTQDPTAPTLSSTGNTDTTVDLSWSGATDNVGVTGYNLYIDGTLDSNVGNVINYTASGLTANTSYDFTVTALDAAGNESVQSNTVSITTDAGSGGGSGDWTPSVSDGQYTDGRVAIGGTSFATGYNLSVHGKMITDEVKVQEISNWPDYVFSKEYELPSLEEVRLFIQQYGHLKNIPSARQVDAEGIELGEMNRRLLEKIEELTLYILQQEKRIQELEKKIR